MKKTIAILLAITMLFTLTACRRRKAAHLDGSMQENANKILTQNPVEFMGDFFPVDLTDTSEEGVWALKNATGLDSAEDITDVAVYEPMTGSQAFSLVLVRVDEDADAKDVAQEMKDNIDPNKWICVRADEVKAAGYGDTVLLIMLDSNLGKTAQSYVDAFQTVCGGELDFVI